MSGDGSDEERKRDGTATPEKVESASSDQSPARSTFTAAPPTDRAFRVRFADADDLAVVSAYLQDAITATTEMIWQKAERRFVMVVHRFMWEKRLEPTDDGSGAVKGSRVNCGLRFEGVERVRFRGFDPADKDKVLNLLTVQMTGKASVTLLFSEDAAIRVDCGPGDGKPGDGKPGKGTALDGVAEDFGAPWPTIFEPSHDQASLSVDGADNGGGAHGQ